MDKAAATLLTASLAFSEAAAGGDSGVGRQSAAGGRNQAVTCQ